MSLDRFDGRSQDRERTVADVLLGALDIGPDGHVLIADDGFGFVGDALSEDGHVIHRWWRVATERHGANVWPSGGPFSAATLRLSKDKGAFEMAVCALASVLQPGAHLWIYGANDEGIKSAHKRLGTWFDPVVTADIRSHCRVVRATRTGHSDGLRGTLDDWLCSVNLAFPDGDVAHHSYPGVFAKGKLDPGTAALLSVLPQPAVSSHILDYACGAGVIGAALQRREPSVRLTLIDADAIAVDVAKKNVPNAVVEVGADPMNISQHAPFDLIVSNPPIHDGKERNYRVVRRLIESAARHLKPGAALWMVVQRQVPVAEPLQEHLAAATCVRDDGRFQVWRAIRS
jgi:16S rRNA (guanine1207-N2)-methyltransferase